MLALIALAAATPAAQAQIGSERYASIVIEAASGRVLSAVDADELRHPASLTKVMTAFLVFDAVKAGRARWTDKITMSATAAAAPPSKIGMPPGSRLTLEQAVLAIVTKSANDVAIAIAEHLGGTEANFARMMTAKAQHLGMRNTVYRNASGLPDDRQVTTARDMATLGRRLILDHPGDYHYFATERFRFRGKVHVNHNNRILSGYEGADGIKTGYIRDSGFNLIASAVRDGRRLIAVVFGGSTAPERDRHMAALLDDGFGSAGGSTASRGGISLVSRAHAATPREDQAAMRRAERQATGRASHGAATGWVVQVGAFSSRRQALAAARSAERKLGIARTEAEVNPIRNRRRTLYRAQVTNLTAAEAREACADRKRRRQACLVIAPTREASNHRSRG